MKTRLENVKDRINKAASACDRDPETIQLLAVSKTVPKERVKEAIDAGVTMLGENYVQEAREKFNALSSYSVSWHLIGHLQTNKAKYAVRLFDLIQTVDSLKLACELDKQAKKIDKIQQVLIQVNIGYDPAKSGTTAEETRNLIQEISHFENLSIRGLMTMPPFFNSPEKVRPFFSALRDLRDRIRDAGMSNVSMDELSMGMTGDFEAAIEEGATMVRIGTAIFGQRT
ncbi:YggS family pyridoxal phosphate-dependent enzyme [Thermodesulfobacteriota bacterium]